MSGTDGEAKEEKGDENRAVAVQQVIAMVMVMVMAIEMVLVMMVVLQDPKNVAELTNYIQNMLQQMQDR